jgi:ribosomal protein L1
VAKTDTAYHKEALGELLVIKEDLKKKIDAQNKAKLDKLLTTDQFTEKEQTELRKLLESNVAPSIKRAVFNNVKRTNYPYQKGGFKWLSSRSTNTECEVDCGKKCVESCDYLCTESVNKKAGIYSKEIEMVSAEIDVLKSVLAQLGI